MKTFNLPCYNCGIRQASKLVTHNYDNDVWAKCTVCGREYPLKENELKNIGVKVFKAKEKKWEVGGMND